MAGWHGKTRVIRALALTVVFLVAAGMGMPSPASAQTPAQGQALGILFLLGASKSGAHASAKTPQQKPKHGIAASEKVGDRLVDVKQKAFTVKEGTLARKTRPTG